MREILFRGKCIDDGKFVYGYVGVFKGKTQIYVPFTEEEEKENEGHIFSAIGGLWYTVNPETVGEFTGLTDKNGKEIFEGDIILFEDESPSNYEYHDSTEMRCGEIKFDDGQFYITNRIAVEMEDLLYYGTIDGEVIGNIHDNPDLVEHLEGREGE